MKIYANINNPISSLNVRESPEISASDRKLVSRNMMLTSDFRPEVEILPFRACAMKNIYNPYK